MNLPSLKDIVYDYISEAIQNCTLNPSDKINELNIAKDLNISRTPIREALIQLSAEGFLEARPRRGFVVKQLTIKDAEEVYSVIGVLDALAIELSIENLNNDDLVKMEKITKNIDDAIKEKDFNKYYKLQFAFHNIYIFKSNNKILIDTLNTLRKQFIRNNYKSSPKQELLNIMTLSNNEHKQMITLIRNKDITSLKKLIITVHWSLRCASDDTVY